MMYRPLVAVSDSVFPNLDPARDVLSQIGAELQMATSSTPDAIMHVAREADALMVTYANVNGEMIQQMQRCRIISRFGIGVDNVDIPAATTASIIVTRVPDYCIDEVSDHTMALLLALVRRIPFANSHVHEGRWEMSAVVPISRLRESILGLFGFGRISRLVASKAKAFGMRVISHDPLVSPEIMNRAGVGCVEFSELLRLSDHISIHAPLRPETNRLFNEDVFRKMKPTAHLINTARGPIVDVPALARALDAGHLAGAALDVMPQEPPYASPLFGRPNVILTPHMSFYSVESLIDLQCKAAQEVVRVFTGNVPLNAVNPEVLKSHKHSNVLLNR
ncbi:MAG TPA: C-terminal binding protein [Candidatus Sulfotelmatobacter sp.]|nr:C-terminal binding protein [Candidatus Sulfotelmatobacter sp.]